MHVASVGRCFTRTPGVSAVDDPLRVALRPNKPSLLTPDLLPFPVVMTIQPSTQKSEHALDQA